jgi:O-acetyl-ADP-ribose deacetylase (regulator of RNase III)
MLEMVRDLWDMHEVGFWCVIPTNGIINARDEAVMGRGVAAQAKRRFPRLPKMLAAHLKLGGTHVSIFPALRLFSFPTKYHWKGRSRLDLIKRSTEELAFRVNKVEYLVGAHHIALPRVGCGEGGLDWEEVRPILAERLDDRFVVVSMDHPPRK